MDNVPGPRRNARVRALSDDRRENGLRESRTRPLNKSTKVTTWMNPAGMNMHGGGWELGRVRSSATLQNGPEPPPTHGLFAVRVSRYASRARLSGPRRKWTRPFALAASPHRASSRQRRRWRPCARDVYRQARRWLDLKVSPSPEPPTSARKENLRFPTSRKRNPSPSSHPSFHASTSHAVALASSLFERRHEPGVGGSIPLRVMETETALPLALVNH